MRKEKGEREREKTWVFPARTIDELKSVERGRAGADTPMLIQDFDVQMAIQDFDVSLSMTIQVFDVPMSIQDNVVPISIRDNEKRLRYKN